MTHSDMPLHVVFVEAWIKKWATYLLAKRSSKDDQAAGKRAVPWGKVDMQLESHIIENALRREVMEEVGVMVDNFQFCEADHLSVRVDIML
jgi:8-oxo-dGTP diphosphatase